MTRGRIWEHKWRASVRDFFKEKVFKTVIPRNVRLAEAPSHGLPVIAYDPKSKGAEAYMSLAREFLSKTTISTQSPPRGAE